MRWFASERGGSTIEYSLAVGLIAAISLISMRSVGGTLDQVMNSAGSRIANTQAEPPVAPTAPAPDPVHASCQAAKDAGNAASGPYRIDPDGAGGLPEFTGWCDMTEDGGGWLLVAYNDATTDFTTFNKSWDEFKAGFGGPSTGALSRGWLGNERLRALTASGRELLVRNTDTGNVQRTHLYSGFQVGTEANFYRLTVTNSGSQNDTGLFAQQHSNRYFSTHDADHDGAGANCAASMNTGWWHHTSCYTMSIAGSAGGRAYWRSASGTQEYSALISMWVR